MNSKQSDLGKAALGMAAMFGILWLYNMAISPRLPLSGPARSAIGMLVLYGAGLALFVWITRSVPRQPYAPEGDTKLSPKTILLCFLLQFTAFLVFHAVRIGITALSGDSPAADDKVGIDIMLIFMLLVFNPIVEELVTRHMFATRLLRHGERFYVLASAFCFALPHGVSQGIAHIFYTFALALIWGYVTVKTGNILWAAVLHMLSNLFCGVIIMILFEMAETALPIYVMSLMALGVLGLVLYVINRKKVILDGSAGLFDKQAVRDVLSNKGIWIYTAAIVAVIVMKSFLP